MIVVACGNSTPWVGPKRSLPEVLPSPGSEQLLALERGCLNMNWRLGGFQNSTFHACARNTVDNRCVWVLISPAHYTTKPVHPSAFLGWALSFSAWHWASRFCLSYACAWMPIEFMGFPRVSIFPIYIYIYFQHLDWKVWGFLSSWRFEDRFESQFAIDASRIYGAGMWTNSQALLRFNAWAAWRLYLILNLIPRLPFSKVGMEFQHSGARKPLNNLIMTLRLQSCATPCEIYKTLQLKQTTFVPRIKHNFGAFRFCGSIPGTATVCGCFRDCEASREQRNWKTSNFNPQRKPNKSRCPMNQIPSCTARCAPISAQNAPLTWQMHALWTFLFHPAASSVQIESYSRVKELSSFDRWSVMESDGICQLP